MTAGRAPVGATVAVTALLVVAAVAPTTLALTALQEEGVVVGRPHLDLFAPDNRVTGGEEVRLDVFVSNDGQVSRGGPAVHQERVTTARNVRFSVDVERMNESLREQVEVLTGDFPAGVIPEGVAGPFGLDLSVDESLAPGTYEIPIELAYDYTSVVEYGEFREPVYADSSVTERATVTLVVRDRPRFELTTDGPVVQAGDAAVRRFVVTNVGTEPAEDATLRLSAGNGSMFFGDVSRPIPTQQASLGTLPPGESRRVSVRVGAAEDAPPGAYPLSATVAYRTSGGVPEQSPTLSTSVPVGAEQTFAVGNVSDTLRVGDVGVVRGRVVNTGGRTVSNAVVVFPADAAGMRARQQESAVGTLEPGEAAPFSFTVDVANRSTAGPRVLELAVRYRNADDEVRVSDPVDAPVAVSGEQTFAVREVRGDLQVGGSGTLAGTVVNTGGDAVADAVVVFEEGGAGLQPRERTFPVGDLAPGENTDFRFPVDVPPSVEAGPQFVTFRVRYRGGADEVRVSDTVDGLVRIGEEQDFAVENTTGTLRVGETGTVRGVVVNTGDGPVENAAVVWQDNATGIQPRETEVAVGTLEPGEAVPFSFTADVPTTADAGPRLLLFRVRYRDAGGDVRVSDPVDAPVAVSGEQTFALRNETATLRVDDTGAVRATLVNTGAVDASGVVLEVESTGPTLVPRETEAAVGDLSPGERTTVSLRFDATEGAEPGPRLVTFRVRYRGQAGEVRRTDPIDARVRVAPERAEFAVTAVDAAVPVGGSEVVTVRLRNREDETLRNLRARLFVDDPLSSDNDEAFVPTLGPNETVDLRFAVSAAGGALPKTYPLLVDVTYEDGGDTVLSDTYFVPVEVTERPTRGLPFGLSALAAGVLGVAVVAAVVAYWKRAAVGRLAGRTRVRFRRRGP